MTGSARLLVSLYYITEIPCFDSSLITYDYILIRSLDEIHIVDPPVRYHMPVPATCIYTAYLGPYAL